MPFLPQPESMFSPVGDPFDPTPEGAEDRKKNVRATALMALANGLMSFASRDPAGTAAQLTAQLADLRDREKSREEAAKRQREQMKFQEKLEGIRQTGETSRLRESLTSREGIAAAGEAGLDERQIRQLQFQQKALISDIWTKLNLQGTQIAASEKLERLRQSGADRRQVASLEVELQKQQSALASARYQSILALAVRLPGVTLQDATGAAAAVASGELEEGKPLDVTTSRILENVNAQLGLLQEREIKMQELNTAATVARLPDPTKGVDVLGNQSTIGLPAALGIVGYKLPGGEGSLGTDLLGQAKGTGGPDEMATDKLNELTAVVSKGPEAPGTAEALFDLVDLMGEMGLPTDKLEKNVKALGYSERLIQRVFRPVTKGGHVARTLAGIAFPPLMGLDVLGSEQAQAPYEGLREFLDEPLEE